MPSLEKSPSLGWGENNEAEREEAEPLEQFRSGLLHLQLRQDSVRQLNGQESSQGNAGTTSLVVNAQTSGTFLFPGLLGVVMMTSSTVYGHNVFSDFSVGNAPFVGSVSFAENFNSPHFAASAQQGNVTEWNSTFSGTRRSGSVPGRSSAAGEFSTEADRRVLRRCVSVGSDAATAENVSSTRTAVFSPDSSTPEEELGAVGGSDIEMVPGATVFADNKPPNSEIRPIEELGAVGGVQPFPTLPTPTPRSRRAPAVDFSLWAQSAPISSPDSQTVQGEHEEEQEDVFDENIPQFHPLQPRGNRGLRCQGPQRRSSCAF